MNIFYLDHNVQKCAEYHNDSHVCKMILELAQLLSTAHRVLDGEMYEDLSKNGRKIKRWKHKIFDNILYKATHVNHPSAKWVRESKDHYDWTHNLFIELCNEFTDRFGKTHLTEIKLKDFLKCTPKNIPEAGFIQPPQAMPEYCRCDDAVEGYRKYYMVEKRHLNTWKNQIPSWYK